MNWSDERYVRVYTRDTVEWVAMGWEAQALFVQLMRKADRAGIVELGRTGARGFAVMVHMPPDVVERALRVLIEDGCVTHQGSSLLVRNFVEAQEAVASNRLRQQVFREKHRNGALREDNAPLQNVTRNNESNPVPSDPIRSDPIRSVPYRTNAAASAAEPIAPLEPARPPPRKTAKTPFHSETKSAIDGFHGLFQAARGADPTWDGKNRAVMNRLVVAAGSAAEVVRRARIMFATAPHWPCEAGGDLRTLAQFFDTFASERRPATPKNGAHDGAAVDREVQEILNFGREAEARRKKREEGT